MPTPGSVSSYPVLVVDDEEGIRVLIASFLGIAGFQVVQAESGEEALSLFASGLEVAAVLLDYRMPGLNGAETLAELRKKGVRAPVVLVSAAMDIFELAAKHGFDAAIPKPCSVQDLSRVLYSALAVEHSAPTARV